MGRRILIRIHNILSATNIETADDGCKELCLLFGCIYRSPNSDSEKDFKINNFIRNHCTGVVTHLLIRGDFNYKSIDWSTYSLQGENQQSLAFLEKIRDCYLYQHVIKPTRERSGDEPRETNQAH